MTLYNKIKRRIRDVYWWWKDRHIVEKICDNPETYLVYVTRDSDKVGVDVFVRSGISIETPATFGVGHLLEHYLSESASRDHQADFYMNGRINHEMMNLYARIDRDKPKEFVQKFLDKIFKVKFDDQEIVDYEKLAIQNELNTDSHSLSRRIERIVETGRFCGECFCIKSFEDSIEPTARLTANDIGEHYDKIFNRQNVKIFINLYSPAAVFKRYLQKILPTYALPDGELSVYPSCVYSGHKIEHIPDQSITGSYIYLTMPALCSTADRKDKIVMRMALDLITGREEAYSVNHLARQEGIYSISSYWVRMEKIGFVCLNSYIPKNRVGKLMEIIGRSLKNIREKPVSAAYLKHEIRDLGNIYRREWRGGDRTNWVIDEIVDEGKYEPLDHYLGLLKTITAEDIQQMARKIIDWTKLNFYIYGEQPEESDEKLLEKLRG